MHACIHTYIHTDRQTDRHRMLESVSFSTSARNSIICPELFMCCSFFSFFQWEKAEGSEPQPEGQGERAPWFECEPPPKVGFPPLEARSTHACERACRDVAERSTCTGLETSTDRAACQAAQIGPRVSDSHTNGVTHSCGIANKSSASHDQTTPPTKSPPPVSPCETSPRVLSQYLEQQPQTPVSCSACQNQGQNPSVFPTSMPVSHEEKRE